MYTSLISCQELNKNLENPDLILVDCRFSLKDINSGRKAYQESHIPGAYYAHLDDDLSGPIIPGKTGRHPLPSEEAATALFSAWGIGSESQVVAYDDMSGAIAARLWWMLRWLGHNSVAVLEEGWNRWKGLDLPVEREVPAFHKGHSFQAKVRPELQVSADFVDQVRQKAAYSVVDSRTPERYRGEQEPIDPVAGHIPGAVNIPHPGNVMTDGNWFPKEVLNKRFSETLHDTPAEQTVFYCGSGVTACRNLLAYYHAGLGEAKLYAGSWSEWIVDADRPVGKGNNEGMNNE